MTETQEIILTNKFSKQICEHNARTTVLHGKAVGLLTNTHCNFKIAVFENGNEMITRAELRALEVEFLNI
jgi:hypothetical protein